MAAKTASAPGSPEASRVIVAVSGSLRARSANAAVIAAAAVLAPPGLEISIFDGLGDLPIFNPDLDTADIPPRAAAWRALVGAAAGLLISSPEYAHGVPGGLKNALDWLVGSPDFAGKPVCLINASALSKRAHASLIETLKTMAARLAPARGVALPWTGAPPTLASILETPELAGPIRRALAALEKLAVATI